MSVPHQGGTVPAVDNARSFPFTPAPGLDLEPEYGWLQEHEPVSRVRFPYGDPAWLVTRYADVRTVLTDPRFSRALSLERDPPRVTSENFSGGIVAMDPPDHTRLRGVCRGAFTPRTVTRLRERATAIAVELLDDVAAGGDVFDAVEDFSVPYTLKIICEMLGVPFEERHSFRRWAEAGLATTSISEDERWAATGQMWDYIAGLVTARRAGPREDLISAMVHAQAERPTVSDEEMVMMVMTILVAGFETTSTQLPNFVHVLLQDPTRFRAVVDDPTIVPGAVEELMRVVPLEATGASPRYTLDEVELSGVRIPAGEAVVAATVIADRDPRVFPDPHVVDLRRDPNPHLGFGVGTHFCLGAPLARMELQVAVQALATRLPGLRGADPTATRWKTGMLVRGPSVLAVHAPTDRARTGPQDRPTTERTP